MALNRSDKSRILRRYFPGMTRNSEMSTEPSRPDYKSVRHPWHDSWAESWFNSQASVEPRLIPDTVRNSSLGWGIPTGAEHDGRRSGTEQRALCRAE